MNIGGDAAAIVGDRNRTVRVKRHPDQVRMTRQRLVDGVVDDLVDHVVQARAVIGVADIHARALADRLEALQDLDRFGAIIAVVAAVLPHGIFLFRLAARLLVFGHSQPFFLG